eukprot:scaffold30817_cov61-Skeletonema_dohrnii-CCMP3373.AAC.2
MALELIQFLAHPSYCRLESLRRFRIGRRRLSRIMCLRSAVVGLEVCSVGSSHKQEAAGK